MCAILPKYVLRSSCTLDNEGIVESELLLPILDTRTESAALTAAIQAIGANSTPYLWMSRWSEEEVAALAELRTLVGDRLRSVPQYPEVVGDRKLLRFLRGHDYNVSKAASMYCQFLDWRLEHRVDEIRESIVRGGLNHPSKFPNGAKILSLIPQVVLAHEVSDSFGCPLMIDQYCFSPTNVMEQITLEECLNFVIHCLEYRSIILEQLSEEAERKKIQSMIAGTRQSSEPYGTILHACVIRDLRGVGLEHFCANGAEIISLMIKISSDNYPEFMRRCFIINTPFIFSTIWYFIKNLLAPRSIAKIVVLGEDYLESMSEEIKCEQLTAHLCGKFSIGNVPFDFASRNEGLIPKTD